MVVYKLIGAGRELIESDVRAPAGIQQTGTVALLVMSGSSKWCCRALQYKSTRQANHLRNAVDTQQERSRPVISRDNTCGSS